MNDAPSTQTLYDQHSGNWARTAPVLLSDFTARPRVLQALGDLTGQRVLDLGCGEGYVSRLMLDAGAAAVRGFDLSAEMIDLARGAIPDAHAGRVAYSVQDLAQPIDDLPRDYDVAVAVFLFNYLTRAECQGILGLVRRHVRPGGRFLFTVPHPSLAWMRPHERPFFFDGAGLSYQDAVDATLEGQIWRRDGSHVPVRAVHKTFSDYNQLLRDAGITDLPRVDELYVTDAHIELDPDFFGPLRGTPLHVLFSVQLPR